MKRLVAGAALLAAVCAIGQTDFYYERLILENDTLGTLPVFIGRAVERDVPVLLCDADYHEVAKALGVETASIRAVVDIEAGPNHQGFWSEGKPLINFDLTMFQAAAKRNGVNLNKFKKSHAVVFAKPNVKKYGSQQAAQQARLDAAMDIDETTAIEGTFWGMFQIGGFNWRRCGCKSPHHFVEQMCHSERRQLDLFANFLQSTKLDTHLRKRNWKQFARGYNGPKYAERNYHTRLSQAYNKHKKNQN